MKKPTEKQPVDELFSRKLGNMSLPPSSNGFERLQARMSHSKPETRLVFWRNPATQRYVAAAACLLVVCLFGWLYWPSGAASEYGKVQMAMNKKGALHSQKATSAQLNQTEIESTPDIATPASLGQKVRTQQVAVASKSSERSKSNRGLMIRSLENNKNNRNTSELPERPESVLAQVEPPDIKSKTDAVISTPTAQTNPVAVEQVAGSKTKPAPVAERVLVVTIDEPQTLVAARQAAGASTEEKPLVALNDKPEKETKAGTLWQQVKRIKQGELFARQDNVSNDDRGLLGRAYSGLKHSFDKDKTAKQ